MSKASMHGRFTHARQDEIQAEWVSFNDTVACNYMNVHVCKDM